MSDDAKEQYLNRIELNDGIRLDPTKIIKNPGLRTLAKLFLNSAWGKCDKMTHFENI
jgi:hypothetical protein